MRGKEHTRVRKLSAVRITPAYAGKSLIVVSGAGEWEDHPRLCGEKTTAHMIWITTKGSPPPMRGKASLSLFSSSINRITPAYAGKSVLATAQRHHK